MELIPKEEFLLATERMFQESIRAKQALCSTAKETIIEMGGLISRAFLAKHRLFLFGNGGSAADAQHLAAEFVNRFPRKRSPQRHRGHRGKRSGNGKQTLKRAGE